MGSGQHQGHSKISWGKILAGAAIVAGAVLFAPGVMEIIPKIFESIGISIWNLFSGTGTEMLPYTKELLTRAAGATLLGGGIAYFMGSKSEDTPAPAYADAESFAIKEQMRTANAMMITRAAYAGNPQAQAMLAQQYGRG